MSELMQVGSLIENCNKKSRCLHRKAVAHKWISDICNVLIVGISSISAIYVISSADPIVSSILSGLVALLKGAMIFYDPERKAIRYERVSIEICRVARKLRKLDIINPNTELVRKVLDKAHDRLDELRVKEFGVSLPKVSDEDYSSFDSTIERVDADLENNLVGRQKS